MPLIPMIVLSTAHPAKFPGSAVEAASGNYPALPDWLSDLLERAEKLTVIDNSVDAVEAFILSHARAVENRD